MLEKFNFIPMILIFIPIFLAISPLLIFSGENASIVVSSNELSEEQLNTLREMELARTPAEVREGKMALNQVIRLGGGEIVIAGTWEGELKLGEITHQSRGSRDIFFATLSTEGKWENISVAGSKGLDSVSSMSLFGEKFTLSGKVNGESNFSHFSLDHDGGWSPTAFEAHLSLDSGWTGVWEIDLALLPINSNSLWCGFA